ncbi:hypothetical protein [Microbacterium sp. C7(2022)]|uniref:hypothetical protein n=1 Tax=Microbacterium sp. C7(2022) TaxID=2992759 RepID=UPI00237A54C1|nr:hypothetical protein [Microbacterium sp. C7(2022)]MDE0545887.1 hypothetical protein [Microbacterium sp. C7(2022)]
MASEVDQLRAELAALRAENAALKESPQPSAPAKAASTKNRRGWWRGLLSAICLILAGIIVPVSIVGGWTRTQLVSEDAFVATFAPLSEDPDVQALIIDEATTAINASIDIESYTDNLFDGLATLDLPNPALTALELLRAPAASGVQSLIDTGVTKVVESDAFSAVWRTALVASHRALVATATAGDSDGVVSLADDGTLGIELGPIIEELKARMIDQGIGIASLIPPIEKTIVLVQSDALLLVGTVYAIAVTVGWWLPIICLALFGLGIALARRRSVAVLGTGVAIAIGAGALALGFNITSAVLGLNAPSLGIPAHTLDTIFFALVGAMRDTAVVLTFLGVVVAVAGWLGGRSQSAARTRALSARLSGSARGALRRSGLNTGAFGDWLYAQRTLVRVAILVLALVLLFALRPLSIGDILLVVILALAVWLIATLLQRSPDDDLTPSEPTEDGESDTLPLDDAIVPEPALVPTSGPNASDPDADTAVLEPTADAPAPKAPRKPAAKRPPRST